MALFVTIVLDGVGVGFLPDAVSYGDEGSNTLSHVCDRCRPHLPNLSRAGLGNILPLNGTPPSSAPSAAFGRMIERSSGKDSTTGHWELAGIVLSRPFPTYPNGFPEDVLSRFSQAIGSEGVLGNVAASGTDIIQKLGDRHIETGWPIVYTSADSVFQIAADKETVPLETLYEWCRIARDEICVDDHAVGRVIARPFVKKDGAFTRVSSERKDFSYLPPSEVLQSRLQDHGVHTISVGKVSDLFGAVGFDESVKTLDNADGIDRTLEVINSAHGDCFIWVNLVDFDQEFGHRNNPQGFAQALEDFDASLPKIRQALPEGSALCITADHGNDPTFPGTDHTREYAPVLYFAAGMEGRDIGTRQSFADHAATVCDYFGIPVVGEGTSFHHRL